MCVCVLVFSNLGPVSSCKIFASRSSKFRLIYLFSMVGESLDIFNFVA